MTWHDAILASEAGTKARPLRLAAALIRLADNKTGRTWAGVATLMKRSRIPDRDNFNKARKCLESIGALKVHPISTLPEEDRTRAVALKDPDGKWYELDIEWAIGVLMSEVEATLDQRSKRPDEEGQNDLGDKVKTTPHISYGSPSDLSDDLLGAVEPSRPADDASGALRSAPSMSSLQSDTSSSLVGQSMNDNGYLRIKDGEIAEEDRRIPHPTTYPERSAFISEATGRRNAAAMGEILAKWEFDQYMTIRTAREITNRHTHSKEQVA